VEEMTAPSSSVGTNSASNTGWLRVDPAYPVLALLPWLVSAVFSRWVYNPLAGTDQWFYFGYFLNYPRYVAEWFPDLYYGSRLSWVLPGYLSHLLFDAKTARYILHVGFYYIAVFSLYGLLRRAAGSRTALLTAVLLGTHSFFLGAIGWDYVDGAGLTYNLLALLCLSQAGASRGPRLWLVASGAAAAAMFYCNAFLVVFLPFLAAFYLYQVHQGFTRTGRRVTLRMILLFALWFGLGAALVTLLLGTVNYKVGGGFWFYGPSLNFLTAGSSKPNAWFAQGWHWAGRASWLALPLMVALGSISFLITGIFRRTFVHHDLRLFFVLQYLGCAGVMVLWHMAGGLGLEGYYYTSYLLPSAFLAMGCMLALRLEHWPALIYWLFLAMITFAFVAALRLSAIGIATYIRQVGWVPMSVSVALCFILNGVLRNRRPLLLLLSLCGFWLCQTAFQLEYWSNNEQGAADLARVVESAKLVREHTGDDPLKFWYNAREPFGTDFNAVHSVYLWSWAMISRDFPAILPAYPVQIGDNGVILSSQDNALQQANNALGKLNLEARVLDTAKIDRDGVRYGLLFFRIVALGAAGQEVPVALSGTPGTPKQLQLSQAPDAAAFPAEQWVFCKFPLTDGRMEVRPDGIHVTTHRGNYSYAAKYGPITAVKAGMYRFVLQFEDLNGALRFGALSGDESHWLLSPSWAARHGGNGTRTAYAQLSAGEQVELMVGNSVVAGPEHSSTFVIKSVRAYACFNK
jgi:hypothetical protein